MNDLGRVRPCLQTIDPPKCGTIYRIPARAGGDPDGETVCSQIPVSCRPLRSKGSMHGRKRASAALPGRAESPRIGFARRERQRTRAGPARLCVASTSFVTRVDRQVDRVRQIRPEGDGKPRFFRRLTCWPARRRSVRGRIDVQIEDLRKVRRPIGVGRRHLAKSWRPATTLDWSSSSPSRGCGARAIVLVIQQGRCACWPMFLP